jgi:hypothetical protein
MRQFQLPVSFTVTSKRRPLHLFTASTFAATPLLLLLVLGIRCYSFLASHQSVGHLAAALSMTAPPPSLSPIATDPDPFPPPLMPIIHAIATAYLLLLMCRGCNRIIGRQKFSSNLTGLFICFEGLFDQMVKKLYCFTNVCLSQISWADGF